MADKSKNLATARKVFDMPEGEVQKGMGEDGEVKGKGKRGRKKKERPEDVDDSPRKGKKRKSEGSQVVQGIGEDDLDLDDVEDD